MWMLFGVVLACKNSLRIENNKCPISCLEMKYIYLFKQLLKIYTNYRLTTHLVSKTAQINNTVSQSSLYNQERTFSKLQDTTTYKKDTNRTIDGRSLLALWTNWHHICFWQGGGNKN